MCRVARYELEKNYRLSVMSAWKASVHQTLFIFIYFYWISSSFTLPMVKPFPISWFCYPPPGLPSDSSSSHSSSTCLQGTIIILKEGKHHLLKMLFYPIAYFWLLCQRSSAHKCVVLFWELQVYSIDHPVSLYPYHAGSKGGPARMYQRPGRWETLWTQGDGPWLKCPTVWRGNL